MAKSKVKRGFLYYSLLFVGLALGVLCIFATILIFNPGQDVYGIGLRFVNYNKTVDYYKTTEADETQRTKIEGADYSTVKFNSGFTNFNVSYDVDEVSTHVQFRPSVTALSQSEKVDFSVTISISNGVLNIDVTEPELWIGFSKTATVYLVCPKNKTFANLDFDITTTTGAIKFDGTSNHTEQVQSLNLKSESGAVELGNKLKITSGDASITAQSSKITVNTNITGTLAIENQKGKVNVGNIAGSANITNTGTLEANFDKVGGDIHLNSKNGYITVNELGTTVVQTMQKSDSSTTSRSELGYYDNLIDNSNIKETVTGYLNGNFVAESNLENTNVIIKKMTGDADIESQTGYVSIDKLGKKADIATTSGSIEIKNAYNNVDAYTTSGAITVTQHGSSASTILNSDTGVITANFSQILSASLTTKGDININVSTGIAFKFVYTAKSISVNWISSALETSGTILVSGASEGSTTIIDANSTNGKITLNDGYVA